MLQKMHDRLQGWTSIFIISVICIIFFLWGTSYYLSNNESTSPNIASVGKSEITPTQLNLAVNNLRQQFLNANATVPNVTELTKMVLPQLIQQQQMTELAKKWGLNIPDSLSDLQIAQLPNFQDNGHFSQQKYDQLLKQSGMNTAQLRSIITKDLLLQQLNTGIVDTDFITSQQQQLYAQLYNQKRNLVYFTVSPKTFKSQINPSIKALKAYYNAHLNQYIAPDEVSLQYIELINLKDDNSDYITTGNRMATLAYENPESLNYVAQKLHLKIQTTPLFTQNTTQYKTDKTSILFYPEVIKSAFSTTVLKQKYNSNIINITPKRAIIIRLNKYVKSHPLSFEKAKQQVTQDYIQVQAAQKATSLAQKIHTTLNKGTSIDIVEKQFDQKAKYLQAVTQNSPLLTPNVLTDVFSSNNLNTYQIIPSTNSNTLIISTQKIFPPSPKDSKLSSADLNKIKQVKNHTIVSTLMQYAKAQFPAKILHAQFQ